MRTPLVLGLAALAISCGGKHHSDLHAIGTPIIAAGGKIHLTIGFTKPMVAKGKVDKPVTVLPIKIAPDFLNDAKWIDERTLVVNPHGNLPVSTHFTVTVPSDTKSLDGTELGELYTFGFDYERITADLDVLGTAERASPDQTLRISFNQRVPLATVLEKCRYTGGAKPVAMKNAPQSPSGPAETYMVKPAEQLATDTPWKAVCDKGLVGTAGPLGLAYDAVLPFHTFGPLKFVKFEQAGKPIVPDESVRLALVFSNPLKAPFKLKLEPPAAGFPQTCHTLDDSSPGVLCTPALDAQIDYTLTVDAAQEDTAGQKLGKQEVLKFHTVDARPGLSVESGYFIAELKRPQLPLWTRNLTNIDVTAVRVAPENFHELRALLQWWDTKPIDYAKTKLAPKKLDLAVGATKNKWSQHPLGAAELFGGTTGPGMFFLELGSKELKYPPFADGGRKKILVNFTDIGVVSKISGSRGLVWATKLSTGKPLAGATVTVRDDEGKVTWTGPTDADGVAIIPGTNVLVGKRPAAPAANGLDPNGEHYEQERGGAGSGDLSGVRIWVSSGTDFTMVNPSRANGLAAWNFGVSVDVDTMAFKLRGFMHTDRGLYRPGEKVHVKGLARIAKLGEQLDVPTEGKPVKATVTGPTGKTLVETTVKLSPFGGFWFDVDLPGDARLGDYSISAAMEGGSFTRTFTVEEFRASTFEVTAKAKGGPVVGDGTVEGEVTANYFYGAPVRGGDLAITVHSRPRRPEFAGFEAYNFNDDRHYEGYHDESELSQQLVTEDHQKLDDKGNGAVHIAVGAKDISRDADLLVHTSVTSPTNEVISKSFSVPYFHSQTYFGVKGGDYFTDVGKAQKLTIVAVGADGKPTSGSAKVTVSRRDWNCVWEDWGYRGNYNCTESNVKLLDKTVQVAGKPLEVEFTPDRGGEYWIAVDGGPTASTAALHMYSYGGDTGDGGSYKSTDSLTLDLVADKKAYKVGDTATLIMKTDLAQATGLVTIERDGVIEKRAIEMTAKSKRIQIPITAAHAPNVYVSVALVQGRMGEGDRGKPRMRMGIINLPVRPADNRLTVSVESDRKDYRPGDQVTATVKVVDSTGKPVAAEVSITAADEGVLSLIGYETPDPVPTFYAPWGLGVSTATQFEYIRDIPGPNQERPATGGDMAAAGTFRSRFVSTAVWAPGALTDANGIATVTFTAPDNLTAFRMMALAADKGHRFGSADKRFTVSKPLQLMSALPRYLNAGDVAQAGVVIHNETGRAGSATVTITADAKVAVAGGLERTVEVAKDASVPVWWQLTAKAPGETKLRFTIAMDADKDAVEFKLPIEHPSPKRLDRVASGVITAPKTIKVAMPANMIAGSAELVMSVDPDGLSGLDEGLRDLVGYPYGCLEQTTSKMIPMIAARELAESLAIEGITGGAIDSYIKAGITKIGLHQTTYGGFSLWPGGEPETYYTGYALWGLYLAKQAGYTVDQTRVDDGLAYLRNAGANKDRPNYYAGGDLGSQAFGFFVRASLGDKAAQPAAAALLGSKDMPIYGKAFITRALAVGLGVKDPVVQKLVQELAAIATAATTGGKLIGEPDEAKLWAYMSSSKRTSAAVLWALVELDPKNAAIRPLVDVMMKNRASGEWYDTQSNAWSLLALSAYAKTLSSAPSSVAIVASGQPLMSGALTGKTRLRVVTQPITAATDLEITPTGEVHYQIGVRYRKEITSLANESHGIKLASLYMDEAGKPRTKFKVGDVIRVKVTAELEADYDHMMMSATLPAGFEPLNTRFKTVAGEAEETHDWGIYREMHDDRVDFASTYSRRGSYPEEFTIRATTAGTFVRPPTIATLMYKPGVFAQTSADMIVIEPK